MLINRLLTKYYTYEYDLLLNSEVIARHGQHSPSKSLKQIATGAAWAVAGCRCGHEAGRGDRGKLRRASYSKRAAAIVLRQGIANRFRRVAHLRGLC